MALTINQCFDAVEPVHKALKLEAAASAVDKSKINWRFDGKGAFVHGGFDQFEEAVVKRARTLVSGMVLRGVGTGSRCSCTINNDDNMKTVHSSRLAAACYAVGSYASVPAKKGGAK